MYETSTIADKAQYRVLVVDDDPEFATFIRTVAENCGWHAATAARIAEMDARFDEGAPDLIFLDLVMPEDDGIEFLSRLQELNYSNDIIFISAYHRYLANAAKLAEAQGLTCREPITKPVSVEKLREAINAAMSDAQSTV